MSKDNVKAKLVCKAIQEREVDIDSVFNTLAYLRVATSKPEKMERLVARKRQCPLETLLDQEEVRTMGEWNGRELLGEEVDTNSEREEVRSNQPVISQAVFSLVFKIRRSMQTTSLKSVRLLLGRYMNEVDTTPKYNANVNVMLI